MAMAFFSLAPPLSEAPWPRREGEDRSLVGGQGRIRQPRMPERPCMSSLPCPLGISPLRAKEAARGVPLRPQTPRGTQRQVTLNRMGREIPPRPIPDDVPADQALIDPACIP